MSGVIQGFSKVVKIASAPLGPQGRLVPVYAEIHWKNQRLSISGVEGPRANGNCWGSCGQIDMHEWKDYESAGVDLEKLRAVWKRWHLNDMRAGCEHQRASWDPEAEIELVTYKLTSEAMQEQKEIIARGERALQAGHTTVRTIEEREIVALPYTTVHAPDADSAASGRYEVKSRDKKTAGWVKPEEHPAGILGKPCEVCGYKYGTEWRKEDVPADVIAWLYELRPADDYPWRMMDKG